MSPSIGTGWRREAPVRYARRRPYRVFGIALHHDEAEFRADSEDGAAIDRRAGGGADCGGSGNARAGTAGRNARPDPGAICHQSVDLPPAVDQRWPYHGDAGSGGQWYSAACAGRAPRDSGTDACAEHGRPDAPCARADDPASDRDHAGADPRAHADAPRYARRRIDARAFRGACARADSGTDRIAGCARRDLADRRCRHAAGLHQRSDERSGHPRCAGAAVGRGSRCGGADRQGRGANLGVAARGTRRCRGGAMVLAPPSSARRRRPG